MKTNFMECTTVADLRLCLRPKAASFAFFPLMATMFLLSFSGCGAPSQDGSGSNLSEEVNDVETDVDESTVAGENDEMPSQEEGSEDTTDERPEEERPEEERPEDERNEGGETRPRDTDNDDTDSSAPSDAGSSDDTATEDAGTVDLTSCVDRGCFDYNPTATCQCDPSCLNYSDCCENYEELCQEEQDDGGIEDPFDGEDDLDDDDDDLDDDDADNADDAGTGEDMNNEYTCAERGCFDYNWQAPCQCDASCIYQDDCCPDYQETCLPGDIEEPVVDTEVNVDAGNANESADSGNANDSADAGTVEMDDPVTNDVTDAGVDVSLPVLDAGDLNDDLEEPILPVPGGDSEPESDGGSADEEEIVGACADYGCGYGSAQTCQCDALCEEYDDCCDDYAQACPVVDGTIGDNIDYLSSCEERGCDSYISTNSCQCDSYCQEYADCCNDYDAICVE